MSSWRRIEDNAIPARAKICGAYVNSALASDEARQCGFDEAILLNESGHVAEGATCNIFMVRKGTLITPPVTENVLEGITRDSVMELARRELGLQVVERPIDRSELYVCDELFFTGTAVGVAPVVRVDHRPVKDGDNRRDHARGAAVVLRCDARTPGEIPEVAGSGLPITAGTRAGCGFAGGDECKLSR